MKERPKNDEVPSKAFSNEFKLCIGEPTTEKDGWKIIPTAPPPKTDPRTLRWPYWPSRR